ncbi:tRNA adenosine(34) deaminase TadA [Lachnoanaerobaculum umeaense]|uniref:tRNA-specific adenosine deaminase n=1 Tax=Lachnoanaerobaculum umeaense TaxID=617123 RepID=A0A385Q3U6_9FIRM|nr:tRNA adenosine(34) deaminase TadA [Lachnoanaerobaculum umeaense]AYB00440.1 nucleoside deaminase [Lachnoanaerobaculum umeaense]PZW91870.1 tRNA(adenine34) deaminase [Lachnoanaerobaculum umeaense]
MNKDEYFLKEAIKLAKKAGDVGDVPIGCVIVFEDKIIARGYNKRNKDKSTLAHAEMIAIKKACKKLGDWRLEDCTMYITLEPCPMCAGAIIQSRIKRVVLGAMNPKAGCAGSILNILQTDGFNHKTDIELISEPYHNECSNLLTSFFKSLRKKATLG